MVLIRQPRNRVRLRFVSGFQEEDFLSVAARPLQLVAAALRVERAARDDEQEVVGGVDPRVVLGRVAAAHREDDATPLQLAVEPGGQLRRIRCVAEVDVRQHIGAEARPGGRRNARPAAESQDFQWSVTGG